ncbi:MAG: uroporphyrinogen decarboxylase [Verrucomicrobiota bacterium]|nr:uroporphyrinogen decarboxylase [Verrucomicrobiota bacterium]
MLLEALEGMNRGRPPVWLMRQAGRYLPEYQALRKKHTLREMFFTPELAAKVTLMPLERFGVDAAILFSDITAIAPAMGLQLEFQEGPVVKPWVTAENWRFLPERLEALEPIAEAVRLVKGKTKVPLIGFCGGPFTVSTYLVEDGQWMERDPDGFGEWIDRLTEVSIASLQRQIEAGADAVQIFDSWANLLSEEQFERYSLRPLKKIIEAIKRPVIVFMRGAAMRAEELAKLGPAAVSVDWERPMSVLRKTVKIGLQGNLNPDVLFFPVKEVRATTRALLEEMKGDPAFIVNLGHGVKPGTPLEAVEALVSEVKSDLL